MRSLGAKKENFGMQIVWLNNAREIWEEDYTIAQVPVPGTV